MRIKQLFFSFWLLFPLYGLFAQVGEERWTVEDVVNQSSVSSPRFSPDGQQLVWVHRRPSKKKDRFVNDLWLSRLDALQNGNWPSVRLTRTEDSDNNPLFSADGKMIYFLSSRKGGKNLWAMNLYGGEAFVVDSFPDGISSIRWLDENTLCFVGGEGQTLYQKELKKKKDDVVVVEDSAHVAPRRLCDYDIKQKTTRRLTDNRYPINNYAISKDGKWAVSSHILSPHYASDGKPKPWYFLWNLESGSKTQILESYQTPTGFEFSADNKGFYFRATVSSSPEWQGPGVSLLYYFDLSTRKIQHIDLDWDWGLSGGFRLLGNDLLLQLANGPTNKMMHLVKGENDWTLRPLMMGQMTNRCNIMQISPDGRQVAFSYSTSSVPTQYRVGRLATGFATSISEGRVFAHINKHLAGKKMAKTEIVRWLGAEEDSINGILYYPHDYEAGRAYPLIIAIHGGPTGVDMDRWSDRWSYYHNLLVQQGCFILKPNYHGSGNHGQEFVESIKANYYNYEITDILAGIEMLAGQGKIDRDSMGLLGWSNGAIISTMLTVRYPDMFRVVAPGAGDVNWSSDYGSCRFGVTFDQYYFGGAPWDDVDGKVYNPVYIDQSPLFELDKVKTPTLICHGSEDRSVPRDQGWEYYRALQQNGQAPVRFLWFPGQPHGLQKISHQTRKISEELAWFKRYLFGGYEAPNEALMKDSPLFALLENERPARDENGFYGVRTKSRLIPETLTVKADSIAIARFELTNAQYQAFQKRHSFPAAEANFPVTGLSLTQARAYVFWLNKLTGERYRLPSLVEAKALHKIARKIATKENSLNRWVGYDLSPEEMSMLEEKLRNLDGQLIQAVGQYSPQKIGEAEIYDLGANVAEMSADGSSYGYSVYDYVDDKEMEVQPKVIGLRLIKEL